MEARPAHLHSVNLPPTGKRTTYAVSNILSTMVTAKRSTEGMPSGELPADCFITIHHASPFLRVRANCWDNFLCYFVSNPMPQFLQFPPTFPQSLARGFTSSILKKSVFVLSMTFLIVI